MSLRVFSALVSPLHFPFTLPATSSYSHPLSHTQDGSSPRHLQGHVKRVTGLHILTSSDGSHKGREVLSSSLDGTLNLWDVSQGSCTRTWRLSKPISSLRVISEAGGETSNVLEGKFACCGHSDGEVSILSLSSSADDLTSSSSSSTLTTLKTGSTSSIESIAYESQKRFVAVGARNGIVTIFQLPPSTLSQLSQVQFDPVAKWRRTEGSSINSLKWSKGGESLLVAGSDGLPYRASIGIRDDGELDIGVKEEFVGLDCDACTEIEEDGEGRVWTSGGNGDGSIRVYERS